MAALHAILYKRDVRASIGWAGFVFIAPFVGALFYLVFGVNRIRRSAASLRSDARGVIFEPRTLPPPEAGSIPEHFRGLVLLGDRVCNNTLVPGNRVEILEGSRAFSAMLAAIGSACRSISLSTYIFEYDDLGKRFVEALAAATARGVAVRVLLDAVGTHTCRRAIRAALDRADVRAAFFLPPTVPGGILSINLRNHRKLTVVDDEVAFTGGMNISDDYQAGPATRRPIVDVHFELQGPVVADLERSFAEDWLFATGERLETAPAAPEHAVGVHARVVADGPDETFERGRWLLLGAIATARRSIRIVTPYFLPDLPLISALSTAALRGVRVEIIIPEVLDHAIVKWASNALLWQMLERGCRVWFTPPPFDHSKLFTVDETWSFFGSSNWDARSFRLNFELNVEAISTDLAGELDAIIERRRRSGREITLKEVDSRPLPVRIRDGLARLLTPYL